MKCKSVSKSTFLQCPPFHHCALRAGHKGQHYCGMKLEDWSAEKLGRKICKHRWQNRKRSVR